MNTRIYVHNLAAATTANELMDLFSVYGNVVDVNIATDPTSGKACGFGFVTMVTPEGARAAIQALNGKGIGTVTLTASGSSEDRVGSPNGSGSPRRRSTQLF